MELEPGWVFVIHFQFRAMCIVYPFLVEKFDFEQNANALNSSLGNKTMFLVNYMDI